jgi:hypothetical protein
LPVGAERQEAAAAVSPIGHRSGKVRRGENNMPDCRRYEGITREKLDGLRQDLLRIGIAVPEDGSGMVEAMGVKLSIAYLPAEQALDVCIIEKPSFISTSLIWGQVEAPLKK